MNTIREIQRINDQELERGIAGTNASWHSQYAKSAWVFVGNLEHELTEGDLICVMSQYGEIEDLHLIREDDTGKSRGFAFCKYEDARSCVLAVDNFCGAQLCGRSIRVDHVENYRLPKNLQENQETGAAGGEVSTAPGHAYKDQEMANRYSLDTGQDLFAPVKDESEEDEGSSSKDNNNNNNNNNKAAKKEAKKKRREERQRKREEKERRKRKKERHKSEKGGRRHERGARKAGKGDDEGRPSKKRRYDSDDSGRSSF